MNHRLRSIAVLAAAAVLATGLGACGTADDDAATELRAALRRTSRLPRSFAYTEEADGKSVTVAGAVADAFRSKDLVAVNGQPVFEETVVDDSVAARVIDSSGVAALGALLGPAAASAAGKGWVVDEDGAPSFLPSALGRRRAGDDVVVDAHTVLSYVEESIGQSSGVIPFNPDSIDYRPDEDPFPRPDDSRGVRRFDLKRPGLPDAGAGGGTETLPNAGNFRKLSVYVREGRVEEVREQVELVSVLDDLASRYDIKIPKGRQAEVAETTAKVLNNLLVAQGDQPIRLRNMTVRFTGVGAQANIALPDGASPGELGALHRRPENQAGS